MGDIARLKFDEFSADRVANPIEIKKFWNQFRFLPRLALPSAMWAEFVGQLRNLPKTWANGETDARQIGAAARLP